MSLNGTLRRYNSNKCHLQYMYARAVYYAVKNGVSTNNEMLNYVHKNCKLLKRSVGSH